MIRTRLVRFLFAHRAWPKRLIAALVRGPVLLNLKDFKLYVRLDDWATGARIAVRRVYEPHVTSALRPYLTPGAVVVDVGANIGYYSMLAAAQVGPAGKVIAFEPSETNCALLRQSAQANRFDQITVWVKAVADTHAVVGYGADDSNGQINPVISARHPLAVESVALDDFLKDEPRVDVIKVDTEGAEDLVLKGMRQLLARHRPVMVTELNPVGLREASGVEPETYLDRLREAGYALQVVPKTGAVAPEPQSNRAILDCLLGSGADHLDLLAMPGGMTQ